MKVCKGCGTDMSSFRGGCPICYGTSKDSGIPIEVEEPKGYICLYCKKISKEAEAFANPHPDYPDFQKGGKYEGLGKHYDGCRGWD